MRPVRLHLDTSDYAAMYLAPPGSMPDRVRSELKEMAQTGRIEIGLSYHVVFELLQKAEPKFREDRLARARLLTELCGRNAFPYPTDLGQGYRFSSDGLWVPRVDLEETEIERVLEELLQGIARYPGLDRHERRVLSKRKYFTAWVRNNPERAKQLARELWPLRFARALAESGDLNRYILGDLTRSEVNNKLWFYITDPVNFYEIWFEEYGRDDPIADRREKMANKFVQMLNELRAMANQTLELRAEITDALAATGNEALTQSERDKLVKVRADLKSFRAELFSPRELDARAPNWKRLFGSESALVAAQIFYALYRETRSIKPSDGIDFVHAVYLPHTDLWRGDKAFADLLVKHRVDFSERVVPTLGELLGRIEAEIAKMGTSS